MAAQDRALTDKELLAVFHDSRADLSLLSREERHRLVALTEPAPAAPETPDAPQPGVRGSDFLPMLGGIVGGFAGGKSPVLGTLGATIGGAAGEGYRQLTQHAGEIIPAIRDVVQNVREQGLGPTLSGARQGAQEGLQAAATQGAIQGGAELLGRGVTAGVTRGAKAVYRGYLKPSLAAKNLSKAREVVDTAISEGIPITRGGAGIDAGGTFTGKAGRLLTEMKQEVNRILGGVTDDVDLKQVADRLRGWAKRKYFKPGADLSDYKAALAVADRIDAHPSLGIPAGATPSRIPVSATQANEVKRALQASAGPSFGVPNAAATSSAEKAGSRYARQAVEHVAGGPKGTVARLNARESKLIDAARAIAQAVEREANQSKLYGVKTLAAGAYGGQGYARGDSAPEALAKFGAARAILQPGTQSYAAIVAARIAKQLGVGAATAARLAAVALRDEGGQ